MLKRDLSLSLLFAAFAFVVAAAIPGFAEDAVEGTIVCVEVDEEGSMQTMTEFEECKGTMLQMGADGKMYALAGKGEEVKSMKGAGEKQTVSGELAGNTRGWILASANALKDDQTATVTGTIVCLLPDYQAGTVKQVVATGPCTELEPHAHVVRTKSGQVYALSGSEDAIKKLEEMSDRNDVELQGKIQGDQGAWVLFVN
ncbi:MAG: hypothetical protein RIG61_12330 [Deltaproteobacteria bacterium]